MTATYKLTFGEMLNGRALSVAERKVLAGCRTGEIVKLGNSEVPERSNGSTRVRGRLIRYLLRGGCEIHRPHPNGVQIQGAWIEGELDLWGSETQLDLYLKCCRFPHKIDFRGARLGGLSLEGSLASKGADMHRVVVKTSVQLRNKFRSKGEIDLGSAQIGGNLDCDNAQFEDDKPIALNCAGAHIGGDAFLRDGFRANGMVCFLGARIGGQFSCCNGHFDRTHGIALDCGAVRVESDLYLQSEFSSKGDVDFTGAHVQGKMVIHKAKICRALSLESATIDSGLFVQKLLSDVSFINLSNAHVNILADDVRAWNKVKRVNLSGLEYSALRTDMRLRERLSLLGRKEENKIRVPQLDDAERYISVNPQVDQRDFDPQPYTQLARVLAELGNRGGAARVRMLREQKIRQAAWRRAQLHIDGSWKQAREAWLSEFYRLNDFFFRWVFGYGYQPARALVVVALLWLAGTWLYGNAYASGQMAPNSDVVLTSEDWIDAVERGCEPVDWAQAGRHNQDCTMPLHLWNGQTEGGEAAPSYKDYETFHAGLYALDLFVPLDALGQEASWAPSRDRGWWGWFGYAMRMPIQMAGWIITAVGAAVLTGLVGRKD